MAAFMHGIVSSWLKSIMDHLDLLIKTKFIDYSHLSQLGGGNTELIMPGRVGT